MTRSLIRGFSELAVTAGVVILLYVIYQAWITDIASAHAQAQISHELRTDWNAGHTGLSVSPVPGKPFAFIDIPRFGTDYSRAIVEGTSQDDLAQGPGHYIGTALPGQAGNFSVAGHRVGRGSPFLDNDQIQLGDPIVVETATQWFTYEVIASEVVAPTDVQVVAPVPDGAQPGSYLTLTTCNPKFSARQRLIVHARLMSTLSKTETPHGPPALQQRIG